MANRERTCAVCGYVSNLGSVARHHLIPKEITQEAGVPDSETINLCCNCYYELNVWCKARVADTTYDAKTRRFREKSGEEKIEDYELAVTSFRKYKREQGQTAGSSR